jgi:penicillin-binding protein 2
MVGGGMAAFMGVLALRMRFMQIDQAEEYRTLAEENRINIRLLAPPRGIIYDRNGVKLADNQQNYRIILVREDAGDIDALIERLRTLVALEPASLEKALREVRRRKPFVPVTLADRLTWEEISRVAVNAPALPGITPEVGLSRGYPLGPDTAHFLGYVGPVSERDLEQGDDDDPLLQIPEFQIGKVGVEAKLEPTLRGKAGAKRIEVNAYGRIMREIDRDTGTPGTDLTLTIDHRLQNFVQARLAGVSASAVVIDTTNGDILSIASAPTFDPNLFVRGISVPDYRRLADDKFRPLASKAVQDTYPPGSTFKMVTRPEGNGLVPGFHAVGAAAVPLLEARWAWSHGPA